MLPLLLLLLLALAPGRARAQQSELSNVRLDPSLQQHMQEEGLYPDSEGVRRYDCPAGFFRLRRNCYYLSGGTAPWRDAHFQCTARNATLAVLDRHGKDKILRKYLMGEQFRRLERWIGGIYNWRQMHWDWGVSGNKVLFENFGEAGAAASSKEYAWHCIVLDPELQYKWAPRSCVEDKYFICEVPAGRVGRSRRRKNISDPLAPQNQRLRPTKKDHRNKLELLQRRRKNKLKSMRKKNWHQRDDNQVWAHGIKFGSRPPKGVGRLSKRPRPKDRGERGPYRERAKDQQKHPHTTSTGQPALAQATSSPNDFGAFPADGRIRADEQLQNLGNDFTREEILLKI